MTLRLDRVTAFYGRVQALFDVDLEVREGELVALLGANGAGKSSVLRAVSRLVRTSGTISLDGTDLTRLSTDAVARVGIAHVPEGRGTFADLTVWQNLQLAARSRRRALRDELAGDVDSVLGQFPVLREFRDRPAGSLSGGQQQMLAIARGLLGRPRVLLIDEPSLGLAPMLAREMLQLLRTLRDRWRLSILLAEQNARLALEIADRAIVLGSGRILANGAPGELRAGDLIKASYLGS